MARKALIIGLGTTGADVCNQMIERLEWENGHLGRTPWIQFLAIETANVTNQAVARTGNSVRLQVESNPKLLGVLKSPVAWESLFQPQKWVHPGLADAIQNIGGGGAGNIRQAGRLALLYPDYYRQVRDGIHRRLQDLSRLTEPVAQQQYAGKEGDAHFPARVPLPGEVAVTLDHTGDSYPVDVYVVGTLCGGTASGTFLDLPYIIRTINAYGAGPVKTIGIFAIYPPNGATTEYGANSYYALREYHHWASEEIEFTALYDRQPVNERRKPYDEFLVISPETEAPKDLTLLCGATCDYVYTRVFSPDAAVVDAKHADFGNGYTQLARNGQQQNFATFGISGIEYPARRMVEACQLTLITRAMERWLHEWAKTPGNTDAAPAQARLRLQGIGVLGDTLLGALLIPPSGGRSILDQMNEHIERRADGCGEKLGELDDCDAQLEIALGTRSSGPIQPPAELPQGCVKTYVEQNRERLRKEVRAKLARQLQQDLLDADLGPSFCRAVIAAELAQVNKELQRYRPDPQTGLTPVQAQAEQERDLKESLRWELSDLEHNHALSLLLSKAWARRQLKAEWCDTTQRYYALRVAEVQQMAIQDILGHLAEDLQRYAEVLSTDSFVERYLGACLNKLKDELTDALNRPYVSKYNLLTPITAETVEVEYQAAFGDRQQSRNNAATREREAQSGVLQALAPLAEGAFASADTPDDIVALIPRGSAAVNPNLDLRPLDRQGLLQRARSHFEAIERRHILDRFKQLGQVDGKREVDAILERTRPMLGIDTGDATRFEDLGMKRGGFLFYNGSRAAQNLNAASPELQNFARMLPEAHMAEDVTPRESNERHRISAIREQTAFPLSIVDGFLDPGAYVTWGKQAPPRATYWSRSDVEHWLPYEPDPDVDEIVRLFLVMVAIREIDTTQPRLMFRPPNRDPVEFPRILTEIRIRFSGEVPEKTAVRVDMINRVVKFQRDSGINRLVVTIEDFLRDVRQYGLSARTGVDLTSEVAHGWLSPFLRADRELWARWQALNPPPQFDSQMLFCAQGAELPGHTNQHPNLAQADGYYCDACGFRFGPSAQDVQDRRSCVRCHKVFVFD